MEMAYVKIVFPLIQIFLLLILFKNVLNISFH